MLVLPSVGSQVKKILLNESATKAKLFFDDGSTAIIATKNTPSTTAVKKVIKTPMGTSAVVQKKKVIKKSVAENVGFRTIKTSQGMINVPTQQAISEASKQNVQDVIARAKKRAELLEAQTMDASARAAAQMTEGAEVSLT